MLKFKNDTEFDKLFIDTNYIFDVIFWVETEWINYLEGNKLHLRNVVATQFKEKEEIQILLNVAEDEASCNADQLPIEEFENGLEIKQQILEFLSEHIEEIKYTIKDKILDIQEIEEGIKSLIDNYVEGVNCNKIYEQIKHIDSVPFNLEIKEGISFENNIRYAKDKDCYLLESRLFNDGKDGAMIDAYLMIINSDMTIVEGYIDDVWSYADFESEK